MIQFFAGIIAGVPLLLSMAASATVLSAAPSSPTMYRFLPHEMITADKSGAIGEGATPAPFQGVVELDAAQLPEGSVGEAYEFDLKSLLRITGEAAPEPTKTAWGIAEGGLPAGLSLSDQGVIQGAPTAQDALGTHFTIQADYKSVSAQRAYDIIVSGASLKATSMALGDYHTCAVTTAGGVKCWGDNYWGTLGNGLSNNSAIPVGVTGLNSGVRAITSGGSHVCALTEAGGVKCWGENYKGKLGDGTGVNSRVPVDVLGLTSGVAAISSGREHVCALMLSGPVKCWGNNGSASVGDGTFTDRGAPVDVVGLPATVTAISAGAYHTCALTSEGRVMCWGGGWQGQLGNGSTGSQSVPTYVSALASGVASISSGGNHTCAITTSGGAKCWGGNSSGELGDGSKNQSTGPVDVQGLTSGVATIAAGGSHTCAVTSSGTAKCWGYNSDGHLGDGTSTGRTTPGDVSGLSSGASSIYAANSHTCAITTSSRAKCWGRNSNGQLGNGQQFLQMTPVDVLPGS